MNSLTFHLDQNLRFVSFSDTWNASCTNYGVPENSSERIRGRCILDMIRGRDTRDYVERLLTFPSQAGWGNTSFYRHDAPGFARQFRMQVDWVSPRRVRVEHALARVEPFPAVSPAGMTGVVGSVAACSVCCRIETSGNAWVETGQPLSLSALGNRFTVCPDCLAAPFEQVQSHMKLTRLAG